MSIVGKTVKPEEAIAPNRPSTGQDSYLTRAVVTTLSRNLGFVAPSSSQSAGVQDTQRSCGIYIGQVWSGSPAAPTSRYTLNTINTIVSLNVPKASRVGWATADHFTLATSDTGPFTYTGPTRNIQFDWEMNLQLVSNPNLLVQFGLIFPGQTAIKGGHSVMLNGSAGTRYRAQGSFIVNGVSGLTFWLGARPVNGTVASGVVGVEEASLVCMEVADITAET